MPRLRRRSPADNDVMYRGKSDADSPGVSAGTLGFAAADQWSALRECGRAAATSPVGAALRAVEDAGPYSGRRGRVRNRPGWCGDAWFRCRRPMVGATGARAGGCHIPCGGGFAGCRGRRPLRRETGRVRNRSGRCGDAWFRCRRPMVGATGARAGFVIGTEATTPPSAAWREKAADTVPCTGEV